MADRIRRPTLQRTAPIRSWSTLLPSQNGEPTPETIPGQDPAASIPNEAVSHAVELGYKVIDDYIERGQRAAERMRRGTYGTDALGEDLQDVAGRLVRYISDFGSTWLEVFDRTGMNGHRPPAGEPAAPLPASPGVPPTSKALHVRVALRSRRPAEVALDITGVPSGNELIVHTLRPPTGQGERLHDVAFVPGPHGGGTITIRVPDDLPAGTYSGLVADAATNRPVGALTVVVTPE